MAFWKQNEDFSARDAGIRVNSYTTVLRRAGLPAEVFAGYWRDVHGPLCSRLPGLGWYVQHHFNREQDGHLWRFADGIAPIPAYVLDGMVEIGFASAVDQATFKKASPLLFSDEQNVFDETVAYDLPHGSTTYVDRFPDALPNGPQTADHLHVHFHAAPGEEKSMAEYLTEQVAKPFVKIDDVLRLRLHLPTPHDNSVASPPAPDVEHSVEPQRRTLGILEIAFASPLVRRQFFTSSAFEKTLKDQPRLIQQASAFAVCGVYTFVRDGKLTTAGLRGSRPAELITRVGAINQVSPEVERIMHSGSL